MSKAFNEVVRREFHRRMSDRLPRFVASKSAKGFSIPGERAYAWSIDASTRARVLLVPSVKGYNQFTIEIGWSRLGRYPELTARPCFDVPSPGHPEFALTEYVCRLSCLWSRIDPWFKHVSPAAPDPLEDVNDSLRLLTKEEAEAACPPLVDDAMSKLLEHGLTYLEEFASHTRRESR